MSTPSDTTANLGKIDWVRGEATGLRIPAHREALQSAGVQFLTDAFHAFGSLRADNRVTRITRCERCAGGSTGDKLFLSVEYLHAAADLHADLFVKFSRDFEDPVRDDRGKYEMQPEIRLAAVSRLPSFPVKVPTAYFADAHRGSNTGLLITERIPFGTGGIEPHRAKCLDHELANPLEHYQAIVTALARVAAAHRRGLLSPEAETCFPYDAAAAAADNPIAYDEQQLHGMVRQYADFAASCPQLLPPAVVTPEFIDKFDREAARFLEHQIRIMQFLQSNPDLIALCHWNAQIDNAWFWRDAAGRLQCGLMDWGHVGQMNVAYSLWGALSGGPLSMWDQELSGLLHLYTDELQRHGGPRIDTAVLELHLQLYIAMMGLSYFLASPARILAGAPDAAIASGPLDPIVLRNDRVRNNLHILRVFLSVWHSHNFGALLDHLPR